MQSLALFNESSKKVLITGGGGFIGSFLTKALLEHANQIVLLDVCPATCSCAYEMGLLANSHVSFIQANILDQQAINQLPNDFDYIIHTAGILGIKKVSEEPLLTADVNVFGTRLILDLARRQKSLKRFLLFSTSEVYGPYAEEVREESPSVIPNVGMRWVYASSKQFSEYLLKAFIQEYNVPGIIIRPFNVYGPYRKGSNAFTTFVTRALRGDDIFITGNGKQSRCWCYIEDFIDGVLKCLTVDSIIGEAFNLGNPLQPLSMYDLAKKICSLTGSNSTIHILESREEDVMDRSPNISKAQRLLGYAPQVDIDRGIKEVSQWMACQMQIQAAV